MTTTRIVQGFPPDQRDEVARLFWEAFSSKLGRVLSPRERALAFLRAALRPDFALSAIDPGGRVCGVAGLKSPAGGLVAADFADLARAYGPAGAIWRAPLLELTERPAPPGRLLLDGLFVASALRGQGIGTRLIEAALAEAAARGCTELRLEVTEGNPRARALYARLGFVAVRDRPMGLLRPILGVRRATIMARPAPSSSER